MSVKLYVQIKKTERGFGTYPLIITALEKSDSEMLFDGKVGAIMYLESPSEIVEEIISYKSNSTSPVPLLDSKGNKIITDCKHSDVKVGQIYKDKCTFISVIARFAIGHSFNYYVKRSDKQRPVVVVDGAHLSGAYKGTFISAKTLDGAGSILSITYGVVDSENDNSWTWFFENFKIAFGERDSMCVVSNCHESIIKANVCTNFKKSKDRLSDIYYAMAKAYRKDEFDFFWNQIGKIDKRVKSYLEDAGFENWARVYAPVNRGSMITSNIAECINGKLKLAHELSIIEFLEQVSTSSTYVYYVYDDGRKYIVCLDRRTCSCGRFQLDEITCEHAIAVLKSKHVVDMKPYCSEFYYPETLRKTYEESMFPMPDKKDWIVLQEVMDEVVLPPKYKRQPEMSKKNRHKKSSETMTSSSNCCGRYGYAGHNRLTCNFFSKKD
ncbi:uncharacterized protein LOC124891730 [Capsicum annuum]|uniref:uncharacterized protein LOC124891730 n=1 Tax=Capsicum annuum TaxID=4072 RepID=UPI001FB06AD5|nr:uncharacterized protein LOC124891730 [Capsicum annuum]